MNDTSNSAASTGADEAAENQDELDAVSIEECGEPLVDFLKFSPTPKLIFAPVHPVFEFPRVHLVRESVAKMLVEAANALPNGLRLQIVEGYRPFAVQQQMWKFALENAQKRLPDGDKPRIEREAGRYAAPPFAKTPPPHLTGGAVDLEIVDENGQRLDFFSPFELNDNAGAAMRARALSSEAEKNRALLRSVLEPTGLTNYADEWWHWSYGDNGWALRVGAKNAIYGRVELSANALWVGDLSKLPIETANGEF